MHKPGRYVTENECVIILRGLIGDRCGVGPVHRVEIVFSDICNAGGETEEESLNRDDVNCIDPIDSIYIGTR